MLYPNPSRRKRPRRALPALSTAMLGHAVGSALRLEAPQPAQGAQSEEDIDFGARAGPQAALHTCTPR